jgi:hypothetical protein
VVSREGRTNGTCNGTIRLTADYVGAASAALESGETTQVFVCATPVNGEISYAEVCGNVTIGYDITGDQLHLPR